MGGCMVRREHVSYPFMCVWLKCVRVPFPIVGMTSIGRES